MSLARQDWEAKLRYKGAFVIARPPTIDELKRDLHKGCSCYSCRVLTKAIEKLERKTQ